jgi:Protein of unknown function (DUF3617)
MKTSMVVGTALLAGYVAAAVTQSVQPLKADTGLWQMSETITWTGLPPEMAGMMANGRERNYTSCVKPEDLRSNPWQQGSNEKCTWTVLTSTATDMDVKGTGCSIGMEGMSADVRGKIHLSDAKNGVGSFEVLLSGNGRTATGHAVYTGKWIGSACH